MSKEQDKVRLKTVDEESEKEESRVVRLREGAVEEVADEAPVRVGVRTGREARSEAASRDELKIRSNEPDIGSLIEAPQPVLEEEWTGSASSRKLPVGWVFLIAAVFAAGIIWSLTQVGQAEKRQEVLEEKVENVIEREMEETVEAGRMVDRIEEVARKFFTAGSIGEMLEHVRHPERVKPLMEEYYSRYPLEPSEVERITTLDPLTVESSGSFWMVGAELDSDAPGRLLVEVEGPDSAKVDWETWVCYQPMEWDEFVSSRPGGHTADFRVYVQPDHFYVHEFSDSDKYLSFRLSTLGSGEHLFGYVPRDSGFLEKMRTLVSRNGDTPTPMILRLHVPEGALSQRGVLVEKLVAERWLFVESPESGK